MEDMTGAVHPLVAFYRDGAPDDENRTLAQILGWDDRRLEAIHDYIQWLFPLTERSGANPSAPTLDDATIQAFRSTPVMRDRLRQAFLRMLRFYGFAWADGVTPNISRAANFGIRSHEWLSPMNHNHLRLTRILRSLRLLGLEEEAAALFRELDAIRQEYPGRITPRTFDYWKDATSS
jgi:hypothetical protein